MFVCTLSRAVNPPQTHEALWCLKFYLYRKVIFAIRVLFRWTSCYLSYLSRWWVLLQSQKTLTRRVPVLELLVRSYYQFNTASCSKLRSEVWSGNLKYCAGRLHGNRLCRTFFFFCKAETCQLGWKANYTHLLFQPTITNTLNNTEFRDPTP